MRAVWAFLLFALILAPSAAAYHGQPGTAGLLVDGPILVDGRVAATASPGAAFWTHDPTFDAVLTAHHVDIDLVRFREGTTLADRLLQPEGTITRERVRHADVDVRFRAPADAFQFLVYPGGLGQLKAVSDSGGRFVAQPPGGVAPTPDAQAQLDRLGEHAFLWGLADHGARLEADAPRVSATGDFTIFVFDSLVRFRDAAGTTTYSTGTSQREDDRGVAYALLHVRGGRLDVAPSTGFVALYGGAFDSALNGTAHLPRAHGAAYVGGEHVLTNGPTVLEGVLDATFTPAGGNDRLRMDASGDMAAMAVTGAAHEFAPPSVAKVSLVLLALAGLAWLVKHGGFAALYSRIVGPKVLEHEERERALALVRERPGLAVADLAAALDVSWSTASYHLMVLEREGMIASDKSGRHRRYVLVGSGADRAALAVASHPTAQALLAAARARPGVTQTELAEAAGITPSTASWHLKRLVEAGLLRVERKWRSAHYSLA